MSEAAAKAGIDSRPHLLIVWHSRTGASEALARAAYDAAEAESTVRLLTAQATRPADLLAAGGYLFICPENLATMSGAMKEMFDRCFYPVLGRIEGRAYGTIIAAGSDGSGAQAQIDRIATGWRLKRVADPLICNFAAQTPEAILAGKVLRPEMQRSAGEIGAMLGAGLALGIF